MVEWGAVGIVWVFFLLVVMPLASLALSIAIPIFCGLCIVWVRKKQRHATWLAFPIIFFGGYFLVWGYSTINLLAVLLEYRSNNPVATVSFDPMKEAIVFPQMAEMELNDLVLTYDLPDLYEIMPGNWGGIQRISARSPSDCAALRLQNSSKTPKNDGGGRPDGRATNHDQCLP